MRKLQEEVRKVVLNYRFEKVNRLRKTYKRFEDEEKMNKYEEKMIKKKVATFDFSGFSRIELEDDEIIFDFEEESDKEMQQTRKHEYFCRKMKHIIDNKNENKYSFDFNKFTLTPRFIETDYQDGR